MADELPLLAFGSRQAWRDWLAEHYASHSGLWLKIAKKEAGAASVTYAEALEEALCFGWIDGQKDKLDTDWWLQRFTPRKARSKWSKINCGKAEALIGRGEMHAAGLREVEQARADGRWAAAYESQSRIEVPEDLQRALDRNEAARAFFATLTGVNRYAVLYRIQDCKKPETRAKRIEKFVAMLERGETIYP
jgi:uncharacterized protein YdeI (YjbR/CyaY-like superfamily)